MYFFTVWEYTIYNDTKGITNMFAIVYYNEEIKNDVIVDASSIFEIIYKRYIEKYKDDKTHNYRITIL